MPHGKVERIEQKSRFLRTSIASELLLLFSSTNANSKICDTSLIYDTTVARNTSLSIYLYSFFSLFILFRDYLYSTTTTIFWYNPFVKWIYNCDICNYLKTTKNFISQNKLFFFFDLCTQHTKTRPIPKAKLKVLFIQVTAMFAKS